MTDMTLFGLHSQAVRRTTEVATESWADSAYTLVAPHFFKKGNRLTFDMLEVGMSAVITATISRWKVFLFALITGDFNRVHFDAYYAAKSIFKHVIVHGAFLNGLLSNVLGSHLPGDGTIYISQSIRYRRAVNIGTQVRVVVTVDSKDEAKRRASLKCEIFRDDGELAAFGEAIVEPPAVNTDD